MAKIRNIIFDGKTYYAIKDLLGDIEIKEEDKKLIHTLSINDEPIEYSDKDSILKLANKEDRERLESLFDDMEQEGFSDFNRKLKKGLNFNPKDHKKD